MLRFCNRIFQTAVRQKTPLIIISLSVHPISGYLAVWNAVCFIYSNLDESSCVHTFADGIFTSTRILADTKCAHFNFCQYCHPQRTLLECYLSLWSEATRSYSGGISGDIVNSTWVSIKFGSRVKCFEIYNFSQPVGNIHEKILLDKFLYFCQYCHLQRMLLNDKPLKQSNLILQQWNQWRNSKLCRSRSSLACNEWNLRLLSPWAL